MEFSRLRKVETARLCLGVTLVSGGRVAVFHIETSIDLPGRGC